MEIFHQIHVLLYIIIYTYVFVLVSAPHVRLIMWCILVKGDI